MITETTYQAEGFVYPSTISKRFDVSALGGTEEEDEVNQGARMLGRYNMISGQACSASDSKTSLSPS